MADDVDPVDADPFLSGTPGTDPTVASVTTGAWSRILADQHLKQETDLSSLRHLDNEPTAAHLMFTWSPPNNAGTSLQYQFSSERNSLYFLTSNPDNAQQPALRQNTAWAADADHSGVMLLRTPPSGSSAAGSTSFKDAILPSFGIDLKVLDQALPMWTMLDALKVPKDSPGGSQVLVAQLQQAPDWAPASSTSPSAPQLPAGVNDRSRTPTNGLWCFKSGLHYSTAITLTYLLEVNLKSAINALSTKFGGFSPKELSKSDADASIKADVTLTKTTVYTAESLSSPSGPIGLDNASVSIALHIADFVVHVDLFADQIRVLLVPTGSGDIVNMINSAFQGSSGDGSTGDVDAIPKSGGDQGQSFSSSGSFASVDLWYVGLDLVSDRSKKISLSWQFGVLSTLKLGNQYLVLALSYDGRGRTFTGQTVFSGNLASNAQVRRLDWDPRLDPAAILASKGILATMPADLDVFALLGLSESESAIPSPKLKSARFEYQKGMSGNPTVFRFSGRFGFGAVKDDNGLIPFKWTDSSIRVEIAKSDKSTDYTVAAADTFTLAGKLSEAENQLDPKPQIPVATFTILICLQKQAQQKTWTLIASAKSLSVRAIESLFDQGAGVDLLGGLTLVSASIAYTFAGKVASSFDVTGILRLGKLELDLKFHRDTSGWEFKGTLRNDSPGSTIAEILESIVPGAADMLPEFVGGIHVDARVPKDGQTAEGLLDFRCNTNDTSGKASLLSVWLQIAGFSFTFAQYKTRAKGNAKSTMKRVLRISVDQIPMIDKIPVVGQMPQPFDHLEYVWVEDDNSKPTVKPAVDTTRLGLTRADLDDMNNLFPKDIPPFQVKDVKTDTDAASTAGKKPPLDTKSASPDNIALMKGHHFICIVGGKVVLDHVFQTTRKETTPAAAVTPRADAAAATDSPPPPASPDAQPTKGSTKTTAGPLSVDALTFQFKQGSLIVSVDATLNLGPLKLSVIGFTLSINLKEVKLDHLADIVRRGLIEASLHGMEVDLAQAPLTLKGVFIHDKSADYASYRGGIVVGFKAWEVLAVGEYYVHMTKGVEDYKAVFVYGKLDGPLIELEFATISGVRLGFGYNFGIRMPDVTELTSFPLITDSGLGGSGNDPAKILSAFRAVDKPFVFPKQNSFWFAAGMTITAFDVLSLTAVLVMDVDTSAGSEGGVILAMLADGVFQMEPLAPPNYSLFYVELVVKVELNVVDGYIAADAAIAPSSHIYVPMAHLTGSASFYTWFGANPHAGEWIVSIGGYARSYTPAEWYPRPSRVGINFTVGDNIHMIGEAYCAVTPKCAMAGGLLHLSLSVGPVSAYADLQIDAYINFKPFHFRAAMSIAVGVECDIDILFVHIHVSIHLGADLVVWGPNDFGGRAHVDFWFFGFDITFGADEFPGAKDPIKLEDFIEMVNRPGPGSSAPALDSFRTETGASDGENTRHKFSVEQGLAPRSVAPSADKDGNFPSTGATTEWQVLAGPLVIRVDCGFTLSKATMIQSDASKPVNILLPDKTSAPAVYSFPMHCQDKQELSSELTLTIRNLDGSASVCDDFRAELVKKSASVALWSKWDSSRDPMHAKGIPDDLKHADGATDMLVQGVRLKPPEPKRALSKIIDMDASAAMKYTIPGTYKLPDQESQGTAYQAAYFEAADAAGQPVDGVTRWADFQKLWVPGAADSAAAQQVAGERKEMVQEVAEVLEWIIRPPEQMAKNVAPPASGLLTNAAPQANAPRKFADGRTDWQLCDEQPKTMVGLLDRYYAALPYVC